MKLYGILSNLGKVIEEGYDGMSLGTGHVVLEARCKWRSPHRRHGVVCCRLLLVIDWKTRPLIGVYGSSLFLFAEDDSLNFGSGIELSNSPDLRSNQVHRPNIFALRTTVQGSEPLISRYACLGFLALFAISLLVASFTMFGTRPDLDSDADECCDKSWR